MIGVLAGMVISAVFEALVSLLKYIADPEDELPVITYWLMGSMSRATYNNLLMGIPFILAGTLIIFVLRWRLNILSLNDDEASSLGTNIQLMRMVFILASLTDDYRLLRIHVRAGGLGAFGAADRPPYRREQNCKRTFR